ncbi:MAG: tetratricopeptide repeat protein [Acidiferrobacterales bacterium]
MKNVHMPKSKAHWLLIIALAVMLQACGTAPTTPGDSGTSATKAVFDESAYQSALGLMKKGEYEAAAASLEELARTDSERAGPYINLGITYLKLDKLEEAKQALLIATERRDGNAIAWNELGLVYRKMGQFENARDAYKKSIRKRARYGKAYLNLGILCDIYLEDLDCAMRNYKRYLDVTADKEGNKQVSIWLADVSRRAGKPLEKKK